MKILLDYVFPITAIVPTPQASTAFLKQVCLVVKPKGKTETGDVTLCTNMTQVSALTDNDEAQQLFNAGMNRVYILPMDDLDLAEVMSEVGSLFFTVLVSSDFTDEELLGGITDPGSPEVEAVAASVKIQDITYYAVEEGVAGNEITIEYEDNKATGNEALIDVTKGAITVDIDPTATTAQTIADAINNDKVTSLMVLAVVDDGDEADIQSAMKVPASLAGGVDYEPEVPPTYGDGTGLDVGTFKGVVGVQSTDTGILSSQAVIERRSAFFSNVTNKAKNMCFAFGSMLSNALNWRNQQYIQMPFADGVDELGEANVLFDDKISFTLTDDEFGNRLGLFAAGGKAIVAPYILKNFQIDIQSAALSYISGNQPAYTNKEATLLEDGLQKVVQNYIDRGWLEAGDIEVKLEQENFVASGYINVAEPKALWRVFGEMRQTL